MKIVGAIGAGQELTCVIMYKFYSDITDLGLPDSKDFDNLEDFQEATKEKLSSTYHDIDMAEITLRRTYQVHAEDKLELLTIMKEEMFKDMNEYKEKYQAALGIELTPICDILGKPDFNSAS